MVSRAGRQLGLFSEAGWVSVRAVAEELNQHHYLGATSRGRAWVDEFGLLVLAHPTSRHLPNDWLELTRWCLAGIRNGGSRQWARVRREIPNVWPDATTVVSYSDPAAGHTGALYKACGWVWAPTWHRLAPPPSGNGSWDGKRQESVKDRWYYPVRKDERRESAFALDNNYQRRLDALKRKNGEDVA